jgi:hypothetical protein
MDIRVHRKVVARNGESPPGPDLVDREMEDREYRTRRIKEADQGLLCVSIEPGEEHLGELYVNTQFEAQVGEYDRCQTAQNRVLIRNSGWMKDILAEISAEEVEWQADFFARPCPHAHVPVALERAEHVLETRALGTGVEQALQEQMREDRQTAAEHGVDVSVRLGPQHFVA